MSGAAWKIRSKFTCGSWVYNNLKCKRLLCIALARPLNWVSFQNTQGLLIGWFDMFCMRVISVNGMECSALMPTSATLNKKVCSHIKKHAPKSQASAQPEWRRFDAGHFGCNKTVCETQPHFERYRRCSNSNAPLRTTSTAAAADLKQNGWGNKRTSKGQNTQT